MSGHSSPGPDGPETGAEVEISSQLSATPPHHHQNTTPQHNNSFSDSQNPLHRQIPQVIQGPQPLANPPPIPPKLSQEEIQAISNAAANKGPTGMFQCTLCTKNFGYKNGLVRHIRLTHVGEKPFGCNICHRRFGYKHILNEHQNLHFGNRPYECPMCDKKFAARSNLIQHKSVHKRPFKCTQCNKRFDKDDQLKKHMYAHPQSVLQCTLCKKNCNNETELKKHIAKVHPNELSQQAAIKNEPMMNQNGMLGGDMAGMGQLTAPGAIQFMQGAHHQGLQLEQQRSNEPVSPPAGASPNGHAQAPHTPPGHTTPPAQAPAAPQPHMVNERGQRIDAICSQLVTSISVGVAQPESSPTPPMHYTNSQNNHGPAGGVTIKREQEQQQQQHMRFSNGGSSTPRYEFNSQGHLHQHQNPDQSPRIASTGSAEYTHEIPVTSQELAAMTSQDFGAAARASFLYSQAASSNPPTPMSVDDMVSKEECQSSALPGIHEMFSKQGTQPKLPGFDSGVFSRKTPLMASSLAGGSSGMNLSNDLPSNLMSAPPLHNNSVVMTSSAAAAAAVAASTASYTSYSATFTPDSFISTHHLPTGGVQHHQHHQHQQSHLAEFTPNPTPPPPSHTPMSGEMTPQRVITPNPPLLPTSHDQATQHSMPIDMMPSLDDVINHYVNQGDVYKCQHCNILFFERGMFFLHSSLHSPSDPWECSICNKVMSGRDEFTLHLFNLPHH